MFRPLIQKLFMFFQPLQIKILRQIYKSLVYIRNLSAVCHISDVNKYNYRSRFQFPLNEAHFLMYKAHCKLYAFFAF